MKKLNYIIYGLMIFAVALFLIISQKARVALYVSLFIFANMVIMSYKKFLRLPIEVEVLTLGIVLTTVQFGFKAGLVVAILGGILGFFVGLDISPFAFPMFGGYLLLVMISYLLRGLPITQVGIISTIVNNLFVFSIYHLAFRYDLSKNLSFSGSNLLLNIVLFANIAPILARIMG